MIRATRLLAPALAATMAAACAGRRAPVTTGPPPSSPGTSAPGLTAPAPALAPGWTQEGTASWYGGDDGFEGKPTASGEIYDSSRLTAAHRELPLGTVIDVTNLENGRTVRLRVNDRGPFLKGRILDVSREAARRLGLIGPGVARVEIEVISLPPGTSAASRGGQWTVQVGSYADASNAAQQAERVRQAGFETFLEPFDGLTRVKIGPFSRREDAEETLARLEAAGFEGIVAAQ